jgi:hypothetical protein
MKLVNLTKWNTKDLRLFFAAGLKAKGARPDKVIRVVYGKFDAHGGHASLGVGGYMGEARRITMTLPGPKQVEKCQQEGKAPLDFLKLAQVFEHEVDHNFGLNHRDMQDWWTLKPTWQVGLEIRWMRVEPAPLSDEERAQRKAVGRTKAIEAQRKLAAKREQRAREALDRAETRLKWAKTLAKKWRQKVSYYDRKAARPR